MKGLRREPMSTDRLKKTTKFENTGDFDVAPGRGRRPILMKVFDEVAVVVADRAERAPNSVQERCQLNWVSHDRQLEKFCAAFYTGTPTRFR